MAVSLIFSSFNEVNTRKLFRNLVTSPPNQVARSVYEHARFKLVGMVAQLKGPLVWIDCEMTGLDVHKDALVEIRVVITDVNLKIADKGIGVLIKPPTAALENMNDSVRNMHTTPGLPDELEGGLSPEKVTGQVSDYIRHFAPEQGKVLLAGNSVGTDKMSLETHMLSAIDHLHYRIVNASSVKELAKCWHW